MAPEKIDFKEILSKIQEFFGEVAAKIKTFEFDPRRMTTSQKRKAIVYGGGALLALLMIILIIVLIAVGVHNKKDKAESGYTFMTDGYEDIVEAECVNEEVIVYTDKNGKKGLITLDGVITQKADQNDIYAVTSEWRKSTVVAEGSSSEYLLYVDTESGTVTTRQYQDVTEAPRVPVWSDESNSLVWRYANGTISSVESSDIVLSAGLYPVAYYNGSTATYGYINQSLQLVIDHTYTAACEFSEELAAVERGSKWGYINTSGSSVIPLEYTAIGEKAYSFRNGLVPVSKDDKCGIITRSGAVACRFDFDTILQGKDGKYIAKKNGKWGLLTVNSDVFDRENTAPPTTEPAAIMYRVNTKGGTLNMRDAASTSGTKICEIPNGTQIEYISSEGEWIKVNWNGTEGYVYSAYVELVG